jgi:hypothetical protein
MASGLADVPLRLLDQSLHVLDVPKEGQSILFIENAQCSAESQSMGRLRLCQVSISPAIPCFDSWTSLSTPVFAAAPNLPNRFPDANIFPSQASTASFRRLDEPNLLGRDEPVSRN